MKREEVSLWDKNSVSKTQNNILVSVIVPIYNVAPYLPQCIESICNQTHTNLEIILVDDASTDASGEICDAYAEKDKRINTIHKQINEGLVSARKTGLQVASGEVVGSVDGDDWIEPDMFKVLADRYLSDDSDIVQSGYIEEGGKSKKHIYKDYIKKITDANRNDLIISWMSGKEILVESQVFTKIYRRTLFQECYEEVPDDMSNGEDWIFFIFLMKKVRKISSVSQCYYHYRIRDDSLSHKKEGIKLLLKEDGLTSYLVKSICDHYPQISNDVIENWVLRRKLSQLKSTLKQYDFDIPLYKFSSIKLLYGKKIIIYGAGIVGRDYVMQISEFEQIQIVKWVDKNFEQYSYPFRKVDTVDAIKMLTFDYIIIAVRDESIAKQIRNELVYSYHIEEEIILWNACDCIIQKS